MVGLGAVPAFAQDDAGVDPFVSSLPDAAAFDGGGYTATDGETLYTTLCAGCHMPKGEGASGAAKYPALSENPTLEYAAYAITLILNGQGAMPSLGHLLSDEQVLEITNFIQSNLDNNYAPDGTLEMVADTRPVGENPVRAEHEIAETEDDNGEPDREDAAEGRGGNEGGSPNPMDAAPAPLNSDTADANMAQDGDAYRPVRQGIPNSDFPILMAVEIPADAILVYLSGTVPQVVNTDAAEGSPERYGDTATQTESTLSLIEKKLASLDLGMGNVVKMQVYLVAPAGAAGMDFAGFMDGYVRFFGTDEQPELPTRSVFEVAGLANPSWLVEIEVVAVRP